MKKKTFTEADLERFQDRVDQLNPVFIFSLTHTQLLSEALKGEFDVVYLLRRELAHRGLDKEGNWVGFKEAQKIHGLSK